MGRSACADSRAAPPCRPAGAARGCCSCDRRSSADRSEGTRLNSSHVASSYAVFCLKKKRNRQPVRAVEMRTEILGVVERDLALALAAEVLIHLDGRYDFVRVRKIRFVPIVENPMPRS